MLQYFHIFLYFMPYFIFLITLMLIVNNLIPNLFMYIMNKYNTRISRNPWTMIISRIIGGLLGVIIFIKCVSSHDAYNIYLILPALYIIVTSFFLLTDIDLFDSKGEQYPSIFFIIFIIIISGINTITWIMIKSSIDEHGMNYFLNHTSKTSYEFFAYTQYHNLISSDMGNFMFACFIVSSFFIIHIIMSLYQYIRDDDYSICNLLNKLTRF